MRWIARIAVALLVMTALLMSLARYVLPGYIEDHKEELLAQLSEMANQPIEADSLRVAWRGDGPALVMRNLQLFDKQRTRANLQAESVTLKFSLFEALRYRNITPEEIAVSGTHLVFIRHEDNSLSIHGIEQQEGAQQPQETAESADISSLLLQPKYLELSNARITVVDLRNPARPLYFSPVNLQIDNRGKRHRLAAELSVENGQQGDMTLIADLAFKSDAGLLFWSGDIYMRTANLNLAWLLENRIPGHYELESARANMEAWSHWQEGLMQRLEGRMLTKNLRFRSLTAMDAPALELDALGGQLRWMRETSGWRLDIHDPSISSGIEQWPTRAVSIALRQFDETQPPELFFGADVLDIETFMHALSVHPPNVRVMDHLLASGLRGQLRKPYLHLRMARPIEWDFSGHFDNLSAYGTYEVPELVNYSIQVDACNNGGRLRFTTEDASVYARNLFRWPIPVTLFQGDIQWQRVRDGYWYLKSDSLALENDHVKTLTAFGLHAERGKPLYLDLKTDFHNADGAYASIYYPATIMPAESLKWLDRSIKHGKVVKGTATIRGELVPALFRTTDSGLFEVVAEIENARLEYHPEWPAIEDVTGRLRFFGNTLTVEADSGHIYDNPIEQATSFMTLNPLSPVNIKGRIGGDLAGPARVLSETPLRQLFGTLTEALDISGDGKVDLDIDVPIKPEHELHLASRVEFDNARVHAKQANITLEKTRGSVEISDSGVSGEGLRAELSGVPIKLSITRRQRDTLVSSSLMVTEKLLAQLAGRELPVSGSARWRLELVIPELARLQRDQMRLTATSNLQGMAVQLPLSLAKSAASKRDIRVRWQPGKANAVDIAYGDLHLRTTEGGSVLTGTLSAGDIRGSLRYPLDGSPLVMDLEKLAVSFDLDEAGSGGRTRLRPYDIPPLDIKAKNFLINGGNFGRLRLRTRHTSSGHALVELRTTGELATFDATGNWQTRGSTLKGTLASQRLGTTLRKLDITDQVVKARGNIELNLDWPGALLEFSLKKANGDIHINTSDGRFTSANPGFGRILGLVNIAALTRRLKLDFSDITKEGFAFDKISAHLRLADGIATLKSVTVKAPAADINATGIVNMTSRELDQEIRVLPDLHGALPLAATAAGGPGAGVAALLIGKIAGKKIDKIAETRYRVTGTLDAPNIERIGRQAGEEEEEEGFRSVDDPLADFQ